MNNERKQRLEIVKGLISFKRADGWCESVVIAFELIHELHPEHS